MLCRVFALFIATIDMKVQLNHPWKIPGGSQSLSGMAFSRGFMTNAKFQEATKAIMAWFFPGGMEFSRGSWINPWGLLSHSDMVFLRGYGIFQGTLEIPRRPPYFTLGTGWVSVTNLVSFMERKSKKNTTAINTPFKLKSLHLLK